MEAQGERIKQIRQALKLSQEKFGEVLGIKKQFVSRIENNSVLLNNDKLVTLLLNFDVNINYILGGIGEMFNTSENSAPENISSDIKDEIVKTVEEYLKTRGI